MKLDDCECGGKVRTRRVTVDLRRGAKLYVFHNVPIGVCSTCGERYYPGPLLEKLDEVVAEITRVVEKKRDDIAKDPLSVSPARLMDLIREKVPAILDVTSPTPLTVQMRGLRVKLPYDTFAAELRKIEIEDGIKLGDVAEVAPSRMRDYILVKILPFSETNTVI